MATTLSQRCCLLQRQLLRSRTALRSPSTASSRLPEEASFNTTHRPYSTARRPRPNYGRAKFEGTGPPKVLPEMGGLSQPLAYGGAEGEDTEAYLKKTSLSPWVPTPDPIARKLFDMSAPTPEDVSANCTTGLY
jgi:hypothetical protein